jgi:hypothetical protein
MVPYLKAANSRAELDHRARPFMAHDHGRAADPVALADM